MGTKERRVREKHELKEQILTAAREMFVHEGFDAVTMRTLAKRIEYSPTAIYLHFKDKESLLKELCQRDLAELRTFVHAEADKYEGLARLTAAAKAYVAFALEHKAQYRLLFMTPSPRSLPAGVDLGGEADRDAYEGLKTGFVQLIAAGAFRPDLKDADMLTQIYFCGLHGIVASAIAMDGACAMAVWRDPATQATFFVESLLKGIEK